MRNQCFAAFLMLCAAAPAFAAGPAVEFTPFATYRFGGRFEEVPGDADRNVASRPGVAFALEFNPDEHAEQYQLFYSRQATRVGGRAPFDLALEYLHFGGTVDYAEEGARYVPYLAGGIGVTRMVPDGQGLDTETHWSISMGGGVKVPLTEHLELRLELRGYFTWLNGRTDIFCVSSNGSATCAIRAKGSGIFQGETLGGISFRF